MDICSYRFGLRKLVHHWLFNRRWKYIQNLAICFEFCLIVTLGHTVDSVLVSSQRTGICESPVKCMPIKTLPLSSGEDNCIRLCSQGTRHIPPCLHWEPHFIPPKWKMIMFRNSFHIKRCQLEIVILKLFLSSTI